MSNDREPSDYPSFYYPELNTPYRGIALPDFIEKDEEKDEEEELKSWEKFKESLKRSWSNENGKRNNSNS